VKRGDIDIFGCMQKLKHTLVNGVKVMEDDYYLIKATNRYSLLSRVFAKLVGENGKSREGRSYN
jgi:hypothetical protein